MAWHIQADNMAMALFLVSRFNYKLKQHEKTYHAFYNKGLVWAIQDIFTEKNLIIGFTLALIGHLAFTIFRKLL